jgi:hypothetical protein
MDDQVEELGNVGFERAAFVAGLINDGHGRQLSSNFERWCEPGWPQLAQRAGAAPSHTRSAFEELVW